VLINPQSALHPPLYFSPRREVQELETGAKVRKGFALPLPINRRARSAIVSDQTSVAGLFLSAIPFNRLVGRRLASCDQLSRARLWLAELNCPLLRVNPNLEIITNTRINLRIIVIRYLGIPSTK